MLNKIKEFFGLLELAFIFKCALIAARMTRSSNVKEGLELRMEMRRSLFAIAEDSKKEDGTKLRFSEIIFILNHGKGSNFLTRSIARSLDDLYDELY